ncbi:MFS general substrate transporter [Clathrospora elynae]|uniref:MFS general substrate transporter n=1 Tax=Clathrospora elynae TaxID=706981 RepID=A0A6A5SE65_9PLEO|nr:MFS general substrate transporter [Clathrospora elynae]
MASSDSSERKAGFAPESPSSCELPSSTRARRLSRQTVPSDFPCAVLKQEWKRNEGFWASFIAICLPLLLSALEGSVTNTALPTISEALGLGRMFSWVATGFLLASTIFQPLYSQLGDMWGRKIPMVTAVGVFAVGSAICGGANSGAVLVFGRIVQGLGTGGIDLFAEMILCDIVPLRKRGLYLAIKHAVFATGTTLGPLLGGYFAERSWRWCFYINLPVCGISMVVICCWLRVGGGIKAKDVKLRDELKKMDYAGSVILTGSVLMLLVALSTGGAPNPWSHPAVVVPLVFGILGLVGFIIWERSTACKHPIMPPDVFGNRTSNISFALTTMHGFITYGFQFYLPPFFQAVHGSSPLKSGKQVMPTTIVIVFLAAAGGPLLSLWGKYKPMHVIGFALMTLGLGLCTMLGPDTTVPEWVGFQLVTAAGLGIVISTMLPAVQVQLDESTTGASAGSWAFLRGTGSLFGVAIPGAIFNIRFASLIHTISSPSARSQLAHGQAYERATASFVRNFDPAVQTEIINAFTDSLRSVWIIFAMLAGIGFAMTWFEGQYKLRNELNTSFGLKPKKSSATTTPPDSGCPSPVKGSHEDRLRSSVDTSGIEMSNRDSRETTEV